MAIGVGMGVTGMGWGRGQYLAPRAALYYTASPRTTPLLHCNVTSAGWQLIIAIWVAFSIDLLHNTHFTSFCYAIFDDT